MESPTRNAKILIFICKDPGNGHDLHVKGIFNMDHLCRFRGLETDDFQSRFNALPIRVKIGGNGGHGRLAGAQTVGGANCGK